MTTDASHRLRELAQRVTDDLPEDVVLEVVLTGSVSRGTADDVSDIELLVVTREPLEPGQCFALARAAGLDGLDTWGASDEVVRRVSGFRDGVSLELIWWPQSAAPQKIDALLAGQRSSSADALVHGVPLRTVGLLATWQERLRTYPPQLRSARIEEAALPWGGFSPAGLLTLIRPDDRLALSEWLVDGATRVLTITFALNGVWEPTSKRLTARVAPLAVKADRVAERIHDALLEQDPRRALLAMTELQLETVRLAPDGPNVERARSWLAAGVEVLLR